MRYLVALLLAVPALAWAQEPPALRAHHLTIDLGVEWSGGYDVGTATAELRGNGRGAQPPSFALFSADSHLASAAAPAFRVGFALTRQLAVEFGAARSTPHIGVTISGDAEAPNQELAGEAIQQYAFDGGVSWQLPASFGRMAPFLVAGGGYLRQLHEDRTLAEGGRIYYAGGGARYWLRGGGRAAKALGVRGDVRVNLRQDGIDFENKMRAYPTVSASLFIGF
jgi:hypothetical protein